VTFYQYFADKEDLFGHLATAVIREVNAIAKGLREVGKDEAGWHELHQFIDSYAETYVRYGPVFHIFETAAETTDIVRRARAEAASANVAEIVRRLREPALRGDQLQPVTGMLLGATARVFYTAAVLQQAAPAFYTPHRVRIAITDLWHRTLFGLDPKVNVHFGGGDDAPVLGFDPTMRGVEEAHTKASELTGTAQSTRDALLAAGQEVFVTRGYHGTRVDDIVSAAGLSHGAFYRYFENKAHFARTLVLEAIAPLSSALATIPVIEQDDPAGSETLRAWLRRYNETQIGETAIIRVWTDATLHDPALGVDAAAALDWGRRQLVRFLQPRDFGDIDTEAVVTLAFLDAFGALRPSPTTLDAAQLIIERGLLGRPS
jgi:AcrR family transcriptional regulator